MGSSEITPPFIAHQATAQENEKQIKNPKMTYVMIDAEADGPIPGDYSMISFGAVITKPANAGFESNTPAIRQEYLIVDDALDKTFYGRLRPITEKYVPEALKVSGHTREETLGFDEPEKVMMEFAAWIRYSCQGRSIALKSGAAAFSIRENCKDRPIFISDNNGFDWMFVCWYFHHFLNENQFGHSSQNLGSLYKGLVKDTFKNFKHLRKTKHTHNPVDDARGNAEALLTMIKENGLRVKL